MECQVGRSEHFLHLLLFAFYEGSMATKAADFYQRVIENLIGRLEEVVDINGVWIID